MFIDTHCHLDMIANRLTESTKNQNYIQSVNKLINEASDQEVLQLITIGVDTPTNRQVVDLINRFPSVYGACGIHPCDGAINWQNQLTELIALVKQTTTAKLVAVGEIGLDFYHPGYDMQQQKDLFRRQIELALSLQLPVIIHSRNAIEETLEIIDCYKDDKLAGVFHCFSENQIYAAEVVKRSFYLGVAGHVTYPKNETLRAAISAVGLDHLLLETDAPFLPPQVIRGKLNTPAQVATIGSFLAKLLDQPLEEVAQKTTLNAQHLFNIPPIR